VPDDDQSEFSINVRLRAARASATVEYMEAWREVRSLPEVASVMSSVFGNSGNYYVQLTPLESRKQSQQDLMRLPRPHAEVPGADQRVGGRTSRAPRAPAAAARGSTNVLA